MQNHLLHLDSSGIQSSLNNAFSVLIEQITPELPHTTFVTDLARLVKVVPILKEKDNE